MAQKPTWCISYGRGLVTSNSICKNSFGRIGEDLRTLTAEVELIINLRLLNVETISNSKSEIPLSPSNLLTMKTSVVMPPPSEFSKSDAYSKEMVKCTTYCRRILKQMDKGISLESTSKVDMEKEDLKLCSC